MCDRLHQFVNFDLDAKLFPQLTAQAFLKAFVRLPFATREFPESAQVSAGVSLRDEKLAVAKDQTGCDLDGGPRKYE